MSRIEMCKWTVPHMLGMAWFAEAVRKEGRDWLDECAGQIFAWNLRDYLAVKLEWLEIPAAEVRP